jgi:hypothetical protein
MNTPTESEYLTVDEVAALLRTTEKAIRKALNGASCRGSTSACARAGALPAAMR